MIERADHWTPPDGLGYSSLRPVRLTARGKALIVLAVGFVIGAVALGVFLERKVQREAAERTLLKDQGIAADAVVTRVWRGGGKDSEHRVTYRFEYGGRTYSRCVGTPVSIWRTLAPGAICRCVLSLRGPRSITPSAWPRTGFRSGFPTSSPRWCPFPRSCCRSLCDARSACSPKAGPRPAGSPGSRRPIRPSASNTNSACLMAPSPKARLTGPNLRS